MPSLADRLTFSLLYQYYSQESDSDAISGAAVQGVRPGALELYPASDKSHIVNAILEYDFGPATLVASSGYQQRDLLFNGALSPAIRAEFDTRFKQFSQELRLSSNGDGPIKYVAGLWYRNFKSNGRRQLYIGAWRTPLLFRIGDDPVDSKSIAHSAM